MNDPTALAWIIVVAYVAGALLGFVAGRAAVGRDRSFWYFAAVLLLLLGLNKQLDLQRLVIDSARDWARADGWYESRRIVQAVFFVVLAAAACAAAIVLAYWLRRSSAAVKVAAGGLLLLASFVLVRAASISHIDAWVTWSFAGLRSGWWLELAGTGLVAGAALVFVRGGRARSGTEIRSGASGTGPA